MSKKKFLNRINEMTRKGIYPSLRILLEEDESDPMGGDNPFGDDSDSSSTDDESDSSSTDDAGDSSSTDDAGDIKSKDNKDIPDDSGITDIESQSIKVDTQMDDIAKNVEILNNKPDISIFVDEYFPNASIVDNKIYNLKNFLMLKEDTDKLEKTLEDMDDILNQPENQEKILQLKKKANALQTGDDNFHKKISGLVSQTLNNIEKFDSLYDISSIAASDMLDSIETQSVPKDLEENIKEYVYQLAAALDKKGVKHALNVSATIEPSNFKNAKGGFNRG